MYKIFVFRIILFCLTTTGTGLISVYALKPDSTAPDSVSMQQQSVPSSTDHMIFVGTGYGNDLMYDGNSLTGNQPFISADLSYFFKRGLWASITAYNLPQNSFSIPMADFSAGYNYVFNDYFDAAISLSSYQTSSKIENEIHESFSFLRIRGGFDWYWLYTRVTAGSILGQEQGVYLYLRNSRYFRTGELGKKGNYFSFDPNVNLLFGNNLQYIETIAEGAKNPSRPGWVDSGKITYEEQNNFSLLKMELSVPTSFYFSKFTIEAEPLYLIPIIKNEDDFQGSGFYFFVNAYFRIL